MKDIAQRRQQIEADGNAIVLVHMESNELAEDYFKKFKLEGVRHVHDPDCALYARFGLTKGSFGQLFGLRTMMRGFSAGVSIKTARWSALWGCVPNAWYLRFSSW